MPITSARRFTPWDAWFGVAAAATVLLVVTGDEPTTARGWAVAALAGLAAWYLAYGQPLVREEIEDHRAYVYFAGAAVLFALAVALVDASSFVLLALCPQAYMLMSAVRATVLVVLLNAVFVGLAQLETGDWADTARGPLPVALVVVAASAVFGTWARGVSTQNDERALLIVELNRSRAEVARLSHEAGTLAERQRLAGDVHDTVAQGLTSIVMLVQAADAELDRDTGQARRHLDLALATARDALAEARAIVGALTPGDLTGSSLPDALRRLAERSTRETGVVATFSADVPVGELPTAVEVVLLRAAQEALTNVARHAGADTVSVHLERTEDVVTVTVADDGRGFDPTEASGGYGLNAMRARVDQVSGRLSVDTAPDRGTTVQVEAPVR